MLGGEFNGPPRTDKQPGVKRRDLGAVFEVLKSFADVATRKSDRRRLASRLRLIAGEIDDTPDGRSMTTKFDLLEACCDALLPLKASVKVYPDFPDRPLYVSGDHEAITAALHEIVASQVPNTGGLWVSVRPDRHNARISLTGNGDLGRISPIARLIIDRAGGRILPLGEAISITLPRANAPR